MEFIEFVESIEFVELVKTETRRDTIETGRDTIEIEIPKLKCQTKVKTQML